MSDKKKIAIYEIGAALQARINCEASGNKDWLDKHTERIERIVADHFPTGSGFDSGTTFNFEASQPDKLVFNTSFHHMQEGMYDGWTDHAVTIWPSFALGIEIKISGKDRNGIKDYIADAFHTAAMAEITEPSAEPVKLSLASVENMLGNNGKQVPNQFRIITDDGVYFQSYRSVIAYKERSSGKVYLDAEKWDYSQTTGKYRNDFLREKRADTERKIKSGEYTLTNLN